MPFGALFDAAVIIDKQRGALALDGLIEPTAAPGVHRRACPDPDGCQSIILLATANDERLIPTPLLSRFTMFVVEVPDRHSIRAIVRAQFEALRGSASIEPTDDAIVDELAKLLPREMKSRLRVALRMLPCGQSRTNRRQSLSGERT